MAPGIFYIHETQVKTIVEPNGVLTDLGRKSVAFVERMHTLSSDDVGLPSLTCQYPLDSSVAPGTISPYNKPQRCGFFVLDTIAIDPKL